MRHVDRIVVVALFALTLSVAAPALLADGGKDMTAAAVKLLASLDDEQRKVAQMSYDDPKRTDWHYIPKKTRKGLTLREMKPEQRELAMHLLRQALSPEAFRKAKRAIELEAVLQAVEKSPRRDPQKYYTTIFGTPSNDGTWGYSFEGHHLSLNWVVKDGKLVCATPLFYGANPGYTGGSFVFLRIDETANPFDDSRYELGALESTTGIDPTLTITLVPEPASAGMIAMGGLMMLARRRRRGAC